MNTTSNAIDELVKKNRRKTMITVVVNGLVLVAVLGWFFLPPMGPTTPTTGTVLRLVGLPSEEGNKLYLMVQIENGQEVRTRIANSSQYRQNGKVKLDKQEPMLFGRTKYRFRGYVDDDV